MGGQVWHAGFLFTLCPVSNAVPLPVHLNVLIDVSRLKSYLLHEGLRDHQPQTIPGSLLCFLCLG